MTIRKELYFNASKDEVWNLLTNPEMTKQYMFGCEVISDWKIGSLINWKGKAEDGSAIIYVKGEVLEYLEAEKVCFSMLDPNMGLKDIPENYVNLCYELKKENDGTRLIIIQGSFEGVENAESRYEESKQGWEMILPIMQSLLED